MTSWQENALGTTDPLWWESIVPNGYPSQSTSNVDLWWFLAVSLSKLLNKHSVSRWFAIPWHPHDVTHDLCKQVCSCCILHIMVLEKNITIFIPISILMSEQNGGRYRRHFEIYWKENCCVFIHIAANVVFVGPFDNKSSSLQWHHNELAGVSNHQPHDCLLNRLFTRRSKKASKLRVAGLCARNSPGTGKFPAQMASNAENVSIWWRHHDQFIW